MPQIHITLTEEEHKLLKKRAKENLNPVTLEARKIIHNALLSKTPTYPYYSHPVIREPIPEECIPKKPIPITVQHPSRTNEPPRTIGKSVIDRATTTV